MSPTDSLKSWFKGHLKAVFAAALVIVAFVAGYYVSGPQHPAVTGPASQSQALSTAGHDHDPKADKEKTQAQAPGLWTCSMHPQIKLPRAGKCPICFMELIPLETDKGFDTGVSLTQYVMSEQAKKLAEVDTAVVKRERANVKVNMVGMVYEDETRIANLPARMEGRLDEIYVDFTGMRVNKGDPMVKIWSPTLIKSQVELFETLKSSGSQKASQEDRDVVKGAEEKLIQLGLTQEQIDKIKEKKKPDLYVTLRAPISGTVMKKMAFLGQFVKEGQDMFIISDLSRVWVKMDAYETDLPWIRYGQDVTFTTPAVPGRTFQGKVLFIDPTLDTKTRSVKVRVEAENPDQILRPGMFVSAEVQAEVDESGRVIKSEWAGKYICPVHPRDEASPVPGTCPESKMPLRRASDFGYVDDTNPVFPLVIPATAPLITGKRAIVYVEVPHKERPTYELREIVLGPKGGDKYLVYKGLQEGERVVTKGNFKIDSAMQILARSSMMNPVETKQAPPTPRAQEEIVGRLKVPEDFLTSLNPLIREYLELKDALVDEKVEEASAHAGKLVALLKGEDAKNLDEKARKTWTDVSGTMIDGLGKLAEAKDVEVQRKAFDAPSEAFAKMLMSFRHAMGESLVVFNCPAAFDEQGAYWVEAGDNKRNPYFGRRRLKGQDMLQCAEVVEKIPPLPISREGKPDTAAGPATDSVPAEKKAAPDTHQGEGQK
jgi:membrane fusion protein, copper/silver efflux system